MTLKRYLKMDLPTGQSAFLWGPRKSGKTTFLKTNFPNSHFINFLDSETLFRFQERPYLIREYVESLDPEARKIPIIIDEVQKNPAILNDVHSLIENFKPVSFILCGSSARQMKKAGVNLLGGRAWRFDFVPLVYPELNDFNLLNIFKTGLLPSHFLAPSHIDMNLKAYVYDYMTQEIQAESMLRNIRAFAKFLDIMAYSHGEILNYTNIARDCAVDAKTIKAYFEILEDMLLGSFVYPFTDRYKRSQLSAHPKFYFFDVGIANFMAKRQIAALRGEEAGRAFEHFIFTELQGHKKLKQLRSEITYWRNKTGNEVDFILNEGTVAIECKISDSIQKRDLAGLVAFHNDFPKAKLIIVCLEKEERTVKFDDVTIHIYPVTVFLEKLWSDNFANF